jgi:TPR repeat protein
MSIICVLGLLSLLSCSKPKASTTAANQAASDAAQPKTSPTFRESNDMPIADLIIAANHGDSESQAELGLRYTQGVGVTRDYDYAVKWLRKAAERGNPKGKYALGVSYFEGLGVMKDEVEGIRLIHESAMHGYAPAQSFLGGMYMYGIRKDFSQAQLWYRKAACQGDEKAERALESLEQDMKEFMERRD